MKGFIKSLKKNSGFTIAEGILALVIIATISMAVIRTLPYSRKLITKARDKGIAMNLAQEVMEELYYTKDVGNITIDKIDNVTRDYSLNDKGKYKVLTVTVTMN